MKHTDRSRASRLAPFAMGLFLVALILGGAAWGRVPQAKSSAGATVAYNAALGQQKRQRYPQAAQLWQKFLKDFPHDPHAADAYYHLGTCQLQINKYQEAARTLRTLTTKFPMFAELDAARFNLGMALYRHARTAQQAEQAAAWKAASRAFETLAAKHPKSKYAASALYYQGECLFHGGSPAEAVPLYRKAIAAHTADSVLSLPDAYYALSTTQQDLQQFQEAAQTYQIFLAKFSKDALAEECRLRQGICLLERKQLAEAEKLLAAAAAAPRFDLADYALYQQAVCVAAQKQPERAAELFARVPAKFPNSEYQAAARVAAGKNWYGSGKYAKAQKMLTPLLADKQPDVAAESAYWLAQTLVKLQKPAEAVPLLERTLAAHPKSRFAPHLALARIGALAVQPKRRGEAARLYIAFVRQHADSPLAPQALYRAALTELENGDYEAASKHAEQFLADKSWSQLPLAAEVIYLAGESALAQKATERAEKYYRRLIAEKPQHVRAARARVRTGCCLHLRGKYDESTTYLDQILPGLKDAALRAEAHLLIGRNRLAAKHYPQAVDACRAARQAKPSWERGDEVLLVLAAALRGAGKLAEACAELTQIPTKYPHSSFLPQALFDLGDMAYEQKKYDEAIAPLQKLVEKHPKNPLTPLGLVRLGRVYAAKKDYKEAVAVFSKCIDAAKDGAIETRYLRGLAYQRLGQHGPAVADFKACLAAAPKDAKEISDARNALAVSQSALNRHAEAAATLNALLKADPDYAAADEVYYNLGFALSEGKEEAPTSAEAAAAFRRLTERFPKSKLAADSWLRLGQFAEKSEKRWADAEKAYAAGLAVAADKRLHERLQHKLGWVRFQRKKYAEAAEVLLAQIEEHPRGELAAAGAFYAAESLRLDKKPRQAVPLFDRLAKRKKGDYLELSLYQAGRCYAQLLDWPQSGKRYAELIARFPKFKDIDEARFGLGLALRQQNKLDEAATVFRQVAAKDNVSAAAARSLFQLGAIALQRKQYDRALEQFLKVADAFRYPELQADSLYEAACCFIAQNDTPHALAELKKLIEKFPDSPRAKSAAKLIEDLKKK